MSKQHQTRTSKTDTARQHHIENTEDLNNLIEETPAGGSLDVANLQHVVGNQATQRMIAQRRIQPASTATGLPPLRGVPRVGADEDSEEADDEESAAENEPLEVGFATPLDGGLPPPPEASLHRAPLPEEEAPDEIAGAELSPQDSAPPGAAASDAEPAAQTEAASASEETAAGEDLPAAEAGQLVADAGAPALEGEAEAAENEAETEPEAAEDAEQPAAEAEAEQQPEAEAGGEQAAQQAPAAESSGKQEFSGEMQSGTDSLVAEAEAAIEQVNEPGVVEEDGAVPDIQRGIISTITGGISALAARVIGPLRSLVSNAWSGIQNFGGRLSSAWERTEVSGWDMLQLPYLGFRVLRDARQEWAAEAIARQQAERQQAVAEGRMTPEEAAEPTALENADSMTRKFEEGVDSVAGVSREIMEGAVLGDFKENPSIWNTIGQIAIGFVPYAGQVADVRDLIATLGKLRKSGWKDPGEWFNLVLTVIGFVPGIGDIIKGVGRGARKFLGNAAKQVIKHAGDLWRAARRSVPRMLNAARRFGSRMMQGAARIGRGLLRRAMSAGRGLMNRVRSVGGRIRSMVSRARQRLSSMVSSLRARASSALSRARGLVGRIGRAISGAISSVMERARGLASRAADMARGAWSRATSVFNRLRSTLTDRLRQARDAVMDAGRWVAQKSREVLQRARQALSSAVQNAIARGRALLSRVYNRVRTTITDGLSSLKARATRFVKEHIAPLKERVLNYLQDRWNKLKEKLGIKNTDEAGGGGKKPGDGDSPTGGRVKNNVETTIDSLKQAHGDTLAKNPKLNDWANNLASRAADPSANLDDLAAEARRLEGTVKYAAENFDETVRFVDPNDLRWTQTTAGGRGRADDLRQKMGENGWRGDPIDVVDSPDGLVTVDHTRAAVAQEGGRVPAVPVRAHAPNEPLPPDMLDRFKHPTEDRFATTWGEAAAYRAGNQKPPLPATGTPKPPKLPKPKK